MRTLAFLFVLMGSLLGRPALAAPSGPSWVEAPVVTAPALPQPATGWWTEEGLYARVHAAPEHRAVARTLADHAAKAVPRLAGELGVSPGATFDIYVAPTAEDFARVQPGRSPEWADGTAWPAHGLVFLRAPVLRGGAATPLTTVLDHEIVHVLLGRAFGESPTRPGVSAPRWLQEGLARLYAGEYGPTAADALRDAGELPTLAALTRSFPADAPGAQVAYAASADFLAWLRREHGGDVLKHLVARMSAGMDSYRALQDVTGRSVPELEEAWRGGWAFSLAGARLEHGALALGASAAAVGLGLAWRRRRARNQARLARWERQEALEDALRERARREAEERARAALLFEHRHDGWGLARPRVPYDA